MSDAETLKRTVKVCMFDRYGTVVDMQGGLVEVATPYLKAKGWTGSPNSFVTWWRRTHFENSMIDALLHRAHTPYREIGQRAVARQPHARSVPPPMPRRSRLAMTGARSATIWLGGLTG